MNILIEATCSLTSGYLIKAIQNAGHRAVGSDITDFNHGYLLCDDFIVMPKCDDNELWQKIENSLLEKKIDIVIPSFDETLEEWAKRKEYFAKLKINIIISELHTINKFQDKWETYKFFKDIGVNTPKTSLEAIFSIVKPRFGRGGKGIFENDFNKLINMTDMISQEKIDGEEYTVDCLFDLNGKPIYIVPRIRIDVRDGKSTKGQVVKDEKINELVTKISENIRFIGPINFQLFKTNNGELVMIEVNPRIAGGMALGIAATENWISLIINNIVLGKPVNYEKINPIKYGLKMVRYYEECFI